MWDSIETFVRVPLSIFLAVVVVAGCGGSGKRAAQIPVHPTRGTVTFKGEPLEAAIVTLLPLNDTQKLPASQGVTDELGEFLLSTYNPKDGAPEGEFYVTISCDDRNGKKIAGEFPELLPIRYQDPIRSGLKVKIEEGENELEPFELVK